MRFSIRLALASLAIGFASQAHGVAIYGLTSVDSLVRFDSATPGQIDSTVAVTGVSGLLLGIDFRPATGQLYALASNSRLYTINLTTGAATAVGSAGGFSLTGNSFGFDFNPTVDRIRVVSDADQNLRLNPNDGTIAATDTSLAYALGDPNAAANPNVGGAAYTNSFAGATATTLYDIDFVLDILTTQNPPNNGTLNTIGSLGLNAFSNVGFDIFFFGNQAFASLSTVAGSSSLYRINLATGAASLVGGIGGQGLVITDIAIAQVPEPATLSLLGVGLVAVAFAARRKRRVQAAA